MWTISNALAQDDGRLPGAIPIQREELPPVEPPLAAPAPAVEVDHTKIKLIEHPDDGGPQAPSAFLYVGGIGLLVSFAMLGLVMFVSRLVAEAPDERPQNVPPPEPPPPPSAA